MIKQCAVGDLFSGCASELRWLGGGFLKFHRLVCNPGLRDFWNWKTLGLYLGTACLF